MKGRKVCVCFLSHLMFSPNSHKYVQKKIPFIGMLVIIVDLTVHMRGLYSTSHQLYGVKICTIALFIHIYFFWHTVV